MKKWITACVCLFLAAGLLAGCGAAPADQTDERLKVVTTIFPAYDWARAVIGEEAEHVELTMLRRPTSVWSRSTCWKRWARP